MIRHDPRCVVIALPRELAGRGFIAEPDARFACRSDRRGDACFVHCIYRFFRSPLLKSTLAGFSGRYFSDKGRRRYVVMSIDPVRPGRMAAACLSAARAASGMSDAAPSAAIPIRKSRLGAQEERDQPASRWTAWLCFTTDSSNSGPPVLRCPHSTLCPGLGSRMPDVPWPPRLPGRFVEILAPAPAPDGTVGNDFLTPKTTGS